jgi:hypothetical protein
LLLIFVVLVVVVDVASVPVLICHANLQQNHDLKMLGIGEKMWGERSASRWVCKCSVWIDSSMAGARCRHPAGGGAALALRWLGGAHEALQPWMIQQRVLGVVGTK